MSSTARTATLARGARARCRRSSDSEEMRCSLAEARLAVAEHDQRHGLSPSGRRAGGARRPHGRTAPSGGGGCAAARRGRPGSEGRGAWRAGPAPSLAGDQHEQLACAQQRAQADGQGPPRHAVQPAEVPRRVGPRRFVQRDVAHVGGGRRARLVERHVAVPAQPQHGERRWAPRRAATGSARIRRAASAASPASSWRAPKRRPDSSLRR